MLQNPVIEEINTAFEKLIIVTEIHDKHKDDSLLSSNFILSSIDTLRNIKKKWPNLYSIYDFISKNEVSNKDKDMLSKITSRLIDLKIIMAY